MSQYEKISIIVAVLAVLISIIAIIVSVRMSRRSLNVSDVQNLISMGNLELSVSDAMYKTRHRLEDLTIQIAPYISKKQSGTITIDEKNTLSVLNTAYLSAIEGNINAYEDACSKYLDKKIDRTRFKKTYINEIRQLVENDGYRNYFDGVTSKYKAILKVYREWNDLEN